MSKNEITAQINDVDRISTSTEFRGEIIANCDIRIDGVFEGKLCTTGKVVLGESARLNGGVVCNSCDIWGSVEGQFIVKETFGLRKSGKITGTVGCQRIFIEEGGIFCGSCKMLNETEFDELKSKFIQK